MGWLWVFGLFALFALPAVLIARLKAPPRERDTNNSSDAANSVEELRRHQFR
jgi:predicted MFS family arabinose efflux permease